MSYNSWTRLDVLEEVQKRLRDSNARFWGVDRLNRYIRDGYREWCIATGANWHRENFPLMASEPLYDLPDRLYKIDRFVYNNYRLDPVNAASFKRIDRVMETEQGEPIAYSMDGDSGDEDLATTSPYQKRLRIIRVPASSYTNLYLEWISLGDDLDSDSSVLWNMADHDIPAVIYYAMWKAFSFEGSGQHVKFAQHFKKRFDEKVYRSNARKNRSRSNQMRRMGEGRPVRGGVRLARMPWNYGKVVR
jgi:hypothetical protein